MTPGIDCSLLSQPPFFCRQRCVIGSNPQSRGADYRTILRRSSARPRSLVSGFLQSKQASFSPGDVGKLVESGLGVYLFATVIRKRVRNSGSQEGGTQRVRWACPLLVSLQTRVPVKKTAWRTDGTQLLSKRLITEQDITQRVREGQTHRFESNQSDGSQNSHKNLSSGLCVIQGKCSGVGTERQIRWVVSGLYK